jgi:plasmid replication initiation protein
VEIILFKPNPMIEGVFGNSNVKDFNIFNKILCDLQAQKANNEFIAVVSLEAMRNIINDINVSTPEKIQKYLNSNFREKTITWEYKDSIISVGLINSIELDKSNMTYKIAVDKEIVNLILNYDKLKTGYTPLDLNCKSKSFYATRIHEYLRKWSGTKNTLTVGLYKLKEILGLEGRYKDYKDFRRRVLDAAMPEIKENFNMEVSYEPIKLGNKITAIKFDFIDSESRYYDFEQDPVDNIETKEVQEVPFEVIDHIQDKLRNHSLKIAISTINRFKEKYSEDKINNAITILCVNSKKGKITAPVKYLTGILENLNNRPLGKDVANSKNLRFNNFEPRKYDYEELEKKLLGWDK